MKMWDTRNVPCQCETHETYNENAWPAKRTLKVWDPRKYETRETYDENVKPKSKHWSVDVFSEMLIVDIIYRWRYLQSVNVNMFTKFFFLICMKCLRGCQNVHCERMWATCQGVTLLGQRQVYYRISPTQALLSTRLSVDRDRGVYFSAPRLYRIYGTDVAWHGHTVVPRPRFHEKIHWDTYWLLNASIVQLSRR